MKVTFELPIEEVMNKRRPGKPLDEKELSTLLEHLQRCTDWERIIDRALLFTVSLYEGE